MVGNNLSPVWRHVIVFSCLFPLPSSHTHGLGQVVVFKLYEGTSWTDVVSFEVVFTVAESLDVAIAPFVNVKHNNDVIIF